MVERPALQVHTSRLGGTMKALLLLSVVACTQETDRRTPITTENQLGVVAMQVDRFDDQTVKAGVFLARSFDWHDVSFSEWGPWSVVLMEPSPALRMRT